jgi:hypothetical protein
MFSREPVLVGLVGLDAVVAAGLGLARVFGWLDWDAAQVGAVVGFVAVVSGFVGGVVRSLVIPVGTVRPVLREAYSAGFETGLFTPVPSGGSVADGS